MGNYATESWEVGKKYGDRDMEENRKHIIELMRDTVDERLYQITVSNPRNREKIAKAKIRPVMLKGSLCFQETAYVGNQVFHKNFEKEALAERIAEYMEEDFRQCEIETTQERAVILVSKKGKINISRKKTEGSRDVDLSHNRTKSYILEEGRPVPFLIDLGVQTKEGKIIRAKYDKFKQINRFLEFIEDILPTLPKEGTLHIIDFGCGKSYLTFAVYYYLNKLQGRDVKITGLDLKKEVIRHCGGLAVKYGYNGLCFVQGDIGDYEIGEDGIWNEEIQEGEGGTGPKPGKKVDMVITLHACDTATDHALAKAVEWGAEVILSVPCCQHEVNKQIDCGELQPILKYGLLKERMSALITDAVRANILEENGYQVQVLEFIDMEHTPKNILIRGVKKKGKDKTAAGRVKEMTDFLHIETALQKLLQ